MWVDRNPCASNPQHPSTAEKATCISGVEPLCISVCSACTQQIAAFRILNFKLAFHHNRAPYQSDRGAPPREIFKGTACSTTFPFKCSDEDERMGRKRLMLTLLAAFRWNPLTHTEQGLAGVERHVLFYNQLRRIRPRRWIFQHRGERQGELPPRFMSVSTEVSRLKLHFTLGQQDVLNLSILLDAWRQEYIWVV